MPRANTNEYLDALKATDGKPLLHTVMFESNGGSDKPIKQSDELMRAARGLGAISGVREVRHIAPSLSSPRIVEELILDDSAALQRLRTDPIHDAVVDVAVTNTNWRVVDRLVHPDYKKEPAAIAAAKRRGFVPVTNHTVIAFSDEATRGDIDYVLGSYRNLLGEAEYSGLILSSEVSESLDRRKGDVAIVRSSWQDLEAAQHFETADEYTRLVANLGDIATQTNVVHHI